MKIAVKEVKKTWTYNSSFYFWDKEQLFNIEGSWYNSLLSFLWINQINYIIKSLNKLFKHMSESLEINKSSSMMKQKIKQVLECLFTPKFSVHCF